MWWSTTRRSAKLRKLTPIEVLTYGRMHPDLRDAAHMLAGTYPGFITFASRKGVAAFFAWMAIKTAGAEAFDHFVLPLVSDVELEEDDVRRGLIQRFNNAGDDFTDVHKLGWLIKAFRMFCAGEKIGKKGLHLRDNEPYPHFDDSAFEAAA
jgi:hypothetical protein